MPGKPFTYSLAHKWEPATTGNNIANSGVTVLSFDPAGSTAQNYFLAAPYTGARKTIYCSGTTQSTGLTIQVRANASSGGAVKFDRTADALVWQVSSAAAVDGGVELIGVNSTKWGVVSVRATTLTTF